MSIKRHIPNLFTLLNLFSGCIAVLFVVHGNFVAGAFCVFLGIFFDFFDGFLARKLGVPSELGLQLDSLADMVTSGLVPGLVMFKLLTMALATEPLKEWNAIADFNGGAFKPLALVGLLITLASAYRLAKFNIDTEQQTAFKGLPTPANALLVLSLPLILEYQSTTWLSQFILNPWFLILFTIFSCSMLNASIRLFALKTKDWSFQANKVRYGFLLVSLVLLLLLQFVAIPIVIALYILLSLFAKNA
ncbi:phosphatidylcholine/phosphatidylserine synthase [Mangrovimonas sp. YM274]|uniref:CDP-alcohol phosphatidyltransferase family protein n=1 Tax=Mangrovimonas sp. YM274 TaxID=3070660 RepID=UPI0027DE17CF|nr:CDP-alcohol phosphatidyltransferase family protein [Mangrovimonas sp. YM274]WMI69869.1 CDP-alcohol phosphatidyltransferase family protein [Mangrovimonas sp. YM274]